MGFKEVNEEKQRMVCVCVCEGRKTETETKRWGTLFQTFETEYLALILSVFSLSGLADEWWLIDTDEQWRLESPSDSQSTLYCFPWVLQLGAV